MITIVIADDHPVVRDGLRGMLAGQPDFEVVGEAADGLEAVDQVARHQPDVVLMDLRMPRLDGVGAIARIRPNQPEIRVLVLTTYDADRDIVRALEAGATGVLLKDSPREDLFRAVRADRPRRTRAWPAAVTTRLLTGLRLPPTEAPSEREIEVLALVAARSHQPGRGTSARHLGGDRQDPSGPRVREARRLGPDVGRHGRRSSAG